MGVSELHTETLLSKEGDVTLTLRTTSGEGKADERGDGENGARDWGDSGVGEEGSKPRLCVESVLLWPLVRCHEEKKNTLSDRDGALEQNSISVKVFKCVCRCSYEPR